MGVVVSPRPTCCYTPTEYKVMICVWFFDQLDLHNEVFTHFWLFNVNLVLSKNDETQILCVPICWWIYCNTIRATAWKSGGQLVSNPEFGSQIAHFATFLCSCCLMLLVWYCELWIRRYWSVGGVQTFSPHWSIPRDVSGMVMMRDFEWCESDVIEGLGVVESRECLCRNARPSNTFLA